MRVRVRVRVRVGAGARVPLTLSSDLACIALRFCTWLISSRSLIAAGLLPSACCWSCTTLRSSSVLLRERPAFSFSWPLTSSSAALCRPLAASKSASMACLSCSSEATW